MLLDAIFAAFRVETTNELKLCVQIQQPNERCTVLSKIAKHISCTQNLI